MPIVNYVREHIRFMEYATDEHLTSSERLLWYALMHVMNQRAQGKVWPEEFIRISNDRLLSYCPMKYDTLAAARNSLKQRGLIEYTRGDKNKVSPAYRMIYFYPEYLAPDTESDAEEMDAGPVYPKIPDKKAGIPEKSDKNSPKTLFYPEKSDYMGGNMGGNMGDYSINYTVKENLNSPDEEDDDEQEELRARAYARAEAAWKIHFGRKAPPALLRDLSWRAIILGMDEEVLALAIEMAARNGAASPPGYITRLLTDWNEQHIHTAADVERYGFIRDAINGKGPAMTGVEDGYRMLDEFRKERENRVIGMPNGTD